MNSHQARLAHAGTRVATTLARGVVWSVFAMLAACALGDVVRTEPGLDLSSLKPGATREQVESVVGKPTREWSAAPGVTYRVYQYYGGRQVDMDAATFVAFFDVVSLGLYEVFYQFDPTTKALMAKSGKKYPLMAVSYDERDVVIGVFTEIDQFTALPADGRPPATQPSSAEPVAR
jgi:hypothetical protein